MSSESPLQLWESFYVIVGSSAGALTGLQFVVMALIADIRRRTTSAQIDAFGTPTIVHFCAVLLLAAVLSAPWSELAGVAIILGMMGGAGIAYVGVVFARARRQQGYKPVFEDWLWHVALPFTSYLILLVSSLMLKSVTTVALFIVGAASLILMFSGIHNAWDTVTWLVIHKVNPGDKPLDDTEPG